MAPTATRYMVVAAMVAPATNLQAGATLVMTATPTKKINSVAIAILRLAGATQVMPATPTAARKPARKHKLKIRQTLSLTMQ